MQELKITLIFNYWASCIGKYTRRSKVVPNTEHKKLSKLKWEKFEEDCRDMSEECVIENVN